MLTAFTLNRGLNSGAKELVVLNAGVCERLHLFFSCDPKIFPDDPKFFSGDHKFDFMDINFIEYMHSYQID